MSDFIGLLMICFGVFFGLYGFTRWTIELGNDHREQNAISFGYAHYDRVYGNLVWTDQKARCLVEWVTCGPEEAEKLVEQGGEEPGA